MLRAPIQPTPGRLHARTPVPRESPEIKNPADHLDLAGYMSGA